MEQLGARAGRRPIVVNIAPGLPLIWVDSNLLVQAIYNLLDNAVKYSPDGSSIEINGRQEANSVIVEVADHGSGIPEKDLDHVFEKFYRVQRPDKITGTGLGLTISRGIVEAHGGKIIAENRMGGGTIIRMRLPLGAPAGEGSSA